MVNAKLSGGTPEWQDLDNEQSSSPIATMSIERQAPVTNRNRTETSLDL